MTGDHHESTTSRLVWLGATLGLVVPAVVTWVYFILAADYEPSVQRGVGLATKTAQFALPVVWTWLVLRERLRWSWPRSEGVAIGAVFGLAVTLGGWLLFECVLREHDVFAAAATEIRSKVAGFGVDSVWKYVVLGVFYSIVHSLLEEYYWRWFVFGQLRRLVPLGIAIATSAIGFAAHHVILVSMFFGWWTWPALLLSAAVAVGGGFWAWLYSRSGSLAGPWLSHFLIDAGIFFIGFQLLDHMW